MGDGTSEADEVDARPTPSIWNASIEKLRVLIVAGFATGIVVAGVGSRLAMLVLRLTSPDHVVGVISDDGFRIGQVTLAGTYNLLAIGAVVGFIGAVAYRTVAPWLMGPSWFRRTTTALGAGLVAGSLLIHADGIDFNLLKPTWLAIGLFIALPALFGAVIGPVIDRVERPGSWTAQGPWRWILPLVLLAAVPQFLPILLIAVPVMLMWVTIRRSITVDHISTSFTLAIRAVFLAIAAAGLVALITDLDELA